MPYLYLIALLFLYKLYLDVYIQRSVCCVFTNCSVLCEQKCKIEAYWPLEVVVAFVFTVQSVH